VVGGGGGGADAAAAAAAAAQLCSIEDVGVSTARCWRCSRDPSPPPPCAAAAARRAPNDALHRGVHDGTRAREFQ